MVRGWSRGSLIHGTKLVQKGAQNLDLLSLSKVGLEHMRALIILDLSIAIRILGAFLLFFIPAIISIFSTALAVVAGFAVFIFAVIYIARLLLGINFAYRRVVFGDLPSLEGIKKGVLDFLKNKKLTILLVLANAAITALGFLLPLVILGGAVGASIALADTNKALAVMLGSLAVPLFIVFIFGFQALNGYFGTFRNFAWTRLYLHIDEQNKEIANLTEDEA
jgi:hypothetical protein